MGHPIKDNIDCCQTSQQLDSSDRVDDSHEHQHDHADQSSSTLFPFLYPFLALVILAVGLYLDHRADVTWFDGWVRFVFYMVAYLLVGWEVLRSAFKEMLKGNLFSEFFLMALATVGAFFLQEYTEAVAVMLFYTIGETFQDLAVKRAKKNIKNLIDQRPQIVTVQNNSAWESRAAHLIRVGDIIQVKAGEKIAVDGILLSEKGIFDTAALTGEAIPSTKQRGDQILAGMINIQHVLEMQASVRYEDSKLSKILQLVQEANAKKAPAELFIRRFAKIYTPIVVASALLLIFIPLFIVDDYVFREWLYKALIFLVISCPCALVISIPLGYFGGIGAASRHGILVKGGNYLDLLAKVTDVVMDKTGTLTEAVFNVQELHLIGPTPKDTLLRWIATVESTSTHPIAQALVNYIGDTSMELELSESEEIAGEGLKAKINGKYILIGNFKLLAKYGISYPSQHTHIPYTTIAIAYDNKYEGYIVIADKIKIDSAKAIKQLHQRSIRTAILSGDKTKVVEAVGSSLDISIAKGDLLPADKLNYVQDWKMNKRIVAFVGDGINDAPVLAGADIGIAMGGLGADASIETAEIIIQDDKPSKIATAIDIAKATKRIVWQNVFFAFFVKVLVLILGAGGLATMWEAIFADVGVALLAILNAIRILYSSFDKEK